MKNSLPLTRSSLFAQIFLWALLLVGFATSAWIAIFRMAEEEPHARAIAQFSASAVNIVRTALLTTSPELRPALLQELSAREGIRLLPLDSQDHIEPLPVKDFSLITHEIQQLLGDETIISLKVNNEPGFWISFGLAPYEPNEFWLILPGDRANRNAPLSWIGWVILVALLTLVMVWPLAYHINRHLKHIANAAHLVGQGFTPPEVPETGPREFRTLANAFNRMSKELQQHEKERSEILIGISHDLRTPLTRMRMEVEFSLPEGKSREYMVSDITLMDAIIGQFLDYARGKDETSAEVNPIELLSEIAHRAAAVGQAVTLLIDQMSPSTPVLLKRHSVVRAIENLLNNAWKYGQPPVTLEGVLKDGWFEIAVSDSGLGIPETEVERLKLPFTRLDTARTDVSGTGLGLAIVERVAKSHNGQLVLSGANTGLRATLRLPTSLAK